MSALTEDDLYDMDDDALEEVYKEAMNSAEEVELDTVEPEEAPAVDDEIVDLEEEPQDELEQPTEETDSDDNVDGEDDVEEESEDEPDAEEGELDGEPEAEDDNSEDDKEPTEDEPQPVRKLKFKANGLEYEFDEKEMMEQFPKVFGQAMDYTKKMQTIKPWRKTIDAIEQAGLGQDDVNLAIDVLKGDKDAIGELLKRTGVDALELDAEESNYVPKDYGRDEKTLALKDVIDEISADPEYVRTQKVISSDWDETSWSEMTQDPTMVKALHVDVREGTYDKVQPIAAKLKVYDGGRKSDLDYYKEAAGVYYAGVQAEQQQQAQKQQVQVKTKQAAEVARVKSETTKRKAVKEQAPKRKSAAPTKVGSGAKTSAVDYLDDSDEGFEEWYKTLEDKI